MNDSLSDTDFAVAPSGQDLNIEFLIRWLRGMYSDVVTFADVSWLDSAQKFRIRFESDGLRRDVVRSLPSIQGRDDDSWVKELSEECRAAANYVRSAGTVCVAAGKPRLLGRHPK